MPLASTAVALSMAVAGSASVAAAGASDPSGSVLPAYIQGGGGAAAVAGLLWMFRLLRTNELQFRTTKEIEETLRLRLTESLAREDQARTLIAAGHEREDTLQTHILEQRARETSFMNLAAEMNAELRFYRERRERGQE